MTIEIEHKVELATGIYPAGLGTTYFLPATIDLSGLSVEFASAVYAAAVGARYFIPGTIELDPVLEFATSIYQNGGGQGLRTHFIPGTIILRPFALPLSSEDTGLRIALFLEDGSAGVFPTIEFEPGEDVEFLYPIIPVPVVNKEIHKTDSKGYKKVTKSEVNQIYSTLKLRIHRNTLSSIVDFIKENRTRIVELSTPGIHPFGNEYTRSMVFIISWTRPIRETQIYWRMDITYLQLQGVS